MAPPATRTRSSEPVEASKRQTADRGPDQPPAKQRRVGSVGKSKDRNDEDPGLTSGRTPGGAGQVQEDGFDALLEPFYQGKGLTEPIDTAKDKWNLLPAFLKVKGLVKQHIDSFNYFVEVELKNIVKANQRVISDIDPRFYLKYNDIYVGSPSRLEEDSIRDVIGGKNKSTVTPNECRLRETTYAAPILVDISYWRGVREVRRKGVCIGRLPIMLRSNKCVLTNAAEKDMGRLQECPLDPGGYFIVNGTEKVILIQEQLSKNRILVEKDVRGADFQASVTSTTHERKSKTYVFIRWGKIFMRHNFINEDIPIVVVFKALGIHSDHEIFWLVCGNDAAYQDTFSVNFEEANKLKINTQYEALEFIGSRIQVRGRVGNTFQGQRRAYVQEAMEALSGVIINHVPVIGVNFRPKALFFAYMVRRVLMARHDHSLVDERDYVGNKRLELAGQLLSLLFEDCFKKFNADFKKTIDKVLKKPARTEEFDAYRYFEAQRAIITATMQRALSTGNWDLKRFKMKRAGVTHVLSRLSYISALGMMTRISSQFEKTRKVSGPRSLQPSQFGMLCPSDTPEGESCGLIKNLALMTHITTDDEEGPVKKLLFTLGAQDILMASGPDLYADGTYIILLNGTPVALTNVPKQFANTFRRLRRMGRISEFVSIYIDSHTSAVKIATDEGRICRPLIIVEKGRSKVTIRSLQALRRGKIGFDDFLARGLVEYLDVNEENDTNIAMYEADINHHTTHLEIEPFTILGAVAGIIPYPHHNQSPRNTYQCAMGKQAIGTIAHNQLTRIDSILFLLVYPQAPLVKTRALELIKYDRLPAGQNAIVAVMSYSGYDIEDALVLNKASCDRGFGRCQVFRRFSTLLRTFPNGLVERIGDPTYENDVPIKKHACLDRDGLAHSGDKISNGEVYMMKQIPVNANNISLGGDHHGSEYRDAPLVYRHQDPAYVDKVMLSSTEQEHRLVKIQTRQTRRPETGDKFSSRHGQKGVVGLIAPQTDLPFSDAGLVPDIIMNPHGFPSRMTVGKMLELVSGKAGVLTGRYQYGTAFAGSKVDDMTEILIQHGFSYTGKDYLTSGITGEPLHAYVFMGPIYYQKLKHMVADKMHSRARGPKATLTRQPMEGRSRDGGLRLGEMERDCLIAYGASQLLLERLMLSSDAHGVDICQGCGLMGFSGWCQSCRKAESVSRVTIPYAAKLLVQELSSMGVVVRVGLEDEFPSGA